MKRHISPLLILLIVSGAAVGQDLANPNTDQLKCFAPFIGTWRYEGPSLEEIPGVAKKGTNCLIEFSWKHILNKGAVESGLYAEMNDKKFTASSKSLNAWSTTENEIVLAGTSSFGAVYLGTVNPAEQGKQLTVSWRGTDAEGSPTSSKAIFTVTDRNTLTFEALEREGPVIQGASPVYTLKRVHRRRAAKTAECPWELVTGHWKLTNETGHEAHVTWKESAGNALVGTWKDESGKATELVGWRPERGELVATGYGDKGEFWEVRFTTVTEDMVKGPMIDRDADGSVRRGTFQITRKSDDELPTLFEGTVDGEKITIKGCFTRVK
jgi:hypothetical protein